MEDSWIFVDDDDSSCSLTDSDKIDSETEAELYSKIHHESNLSYMNSENLNEKPSGLLVYSPFKDDVFCIDKRNNASTPMKPASEHQFFNQITHNNSSNEKRKSSEMITDCEKSDEKLNPLKKHKSVCRSIDINSDNLENGNVSPQFRINNIQNENRIFNSNSRNNSNKKNDTVVLNSSDSDNDIWIESNFTEKSDLKINLLKNIDTILLSSSDSDNEPDVSSSFLKRDLVFKNLSMSSVKTGENSKGLWHINYEDLHRAKRHSFRYHENFDVTCSNCNRKGHTSRNCPSPRVIKCFVCGGNHLGFRCSNRICSNCHASGHDRKNCWREVYRGFCHLCNMEGHEKGNCPDLWRRYHLTTNSVKIEKGKQIQQDTNIYCWNCGIGGHFGAVCPMSHCSGNSFGTWPCVISYDNPKTLLKKRLFALKKFPCLNMEKLNRRKNLVRTDLKCFNSQDIVKERNFPRTPKKKSPIKCSKNFDKFEQNTVSPQSLMKKQLNKFKRQWNMKAKRINLSSKEFQDMSQDEVSRMLNETISVNSEDSLPESLKLQVQKRFKKWVRNRIKCLKKLKQNIS